MPIILIGFLFLGLEPLSFATVVRFEASGLVSKVDEGELSFFNSQTNAYTSLKRQCSEFGGKITDLCVQEEKFISEYSSMDTGAGYYEAEYYYALSKLIAGCAVPKAQGKISKFFKGDWPAFDKSECKKEMKVEDFPTSRLKCRVSVGLDRVHEAYGNEGLMRLCAQTEKFVVDELKLKSSDYESLGVYESRLHVEADPLLQPFTYMVEVMINRDKGKFIKVGMNVEDSSAVIEGLPGWQEMIQHKVIRVID